MNFQAPPNIKNIYFFKYIQLYINTYNYINKKTWQIFHFWLSDFFGGFVFIWKTINRVGVQHYVHCKIWALMQNQLISTVIKHNAVSASLFCFMWGGGGYSALFLLHNTSLVLLLTRSPLCHLVPWWHSGRVMNHIRRERERAWEGSRSVCRLAVK